MIELRNVSFSYEGKPVVSRLSTRFEAPGAYALVGPSGCGKTTLMMLLAGLLKPTDGEVSYTGNPRIAVCFQEDRLMPWLTVLQNVAMSIPEQLKTRRLAAGRAWLSSIGLADAANQYPAALSGGMKRRAALARALAYEGDILLLDEPFRALDEEMHQEMLHFVRTHGQGKLLILVTHDMRDTEGMRVLRL